jgi:hypothetical protein
MRVRQRGLGASLLPLLLCRLLIPTSRCPSTSMVRACAPVRRVCSLRLLSIQSRCSQWRLVSASTLLPLPLAPSFIYPLLLHTAAMPSPHILLHVQTLLSVAALCFRDVMGTCPASLLISQARHLLFVRGSLFRVELCSVVYRAKCISALQYVAREWKLAPKRNSCDPWLNGRGGRHPACLNTLHRDGGGGGRQSAFAKTKWPRRSSPPRWTIRWLVCI